MRWISSTILHRTIYIINHLTGEWENGMSDNLQGLIILHLKYKLVFNYMSIFFILHYSSNHHLMIVFDLICTQIPVM